MNKCNDKWTGKDKALHFGVCLVLAVINPIVAVLVAIGKEIWDMEKPDNHFCIKDLVADAVGIAVGSAVHVGIVYLIYNIL